MSRKRRVVSVVLGLALVLFLMLASWVQWSTWPDPVATEAFGDPDVIVILGGGDDARVRQGLRLARGNPETPLIVTGDGGTIVEGLLAGGLPAERLIHETAATSTVENAKFTASILDQLKARKVILVTNWFHAPRALAIFRKYQPGREFVVSFEPKPDPLTKWDKETQRRERMAVIYNLLVHGLGF